MQFDNHIDFLLDVRIQGIQFDSNCHNSITFTPNGDSGLRLFLEQKGELKKDEFSNQHLHCKVVATYPATKDQALFVDSYNNRKVMVPLPME